MRNSEFWDKHVCWDGTALCQSFLSITPTDWRGGAWSAYHFNSESLVYWGLWLLLCAVTWFSVIPTPVVCLCRIFVGTDLPWAKRPVILNKCSCLPLGNSLLIVHKTPDYTCPRQSSIFLLEELLYSRAHFEALLFPLVLFVFILPWEEWNDKRNVLDKVYCLRLSQRTKTTVTR